MNQNLRESRTEKPRGPGQDLHQQAGAAFRAGRTAESIALLEQAGALLPGSAAVKCDLAIAAWRSGNLARAEEYYADAIASDPQNLYALARFSVFLLQNNRAEEAQALLQRACAISSSSSHPEILNGLGLQRFKAGDMAGAQDLFMRALKAAPSFAEAHINLGDVLASAQRHAVAEEAYRHALKLDAGSIEAAVALAELCFLVKKEKREEEAVTLLKRAAVQEPENLLPRLRLIIMLEALNRIDEADAELAGAKRSFPPGPGLVMAEARLLRRQDKIGDAIALLEKHEEHLGGNAPKAAAYYYELGQLYDRSGAADKAFRAFTAANIAQQENPKFRRLDKGVSSRFMTRMRQEYTPELIARFTPAPKLAQQQTPVFLVGFPRSGTTLLEQILSSSPGVHVADEISAVDNVLVETVRRFARKDRASVAGLNPDWVLDDDCYPACLAGLKDLDIEAMRRIYFASHQRPGGEQNEGILVDKLPLNLLHAGLIIRMFPDAKFILALRHPCDAVLSFFMQEFVPNTYMVRSLDLGDAAKLYDEAFTLWRHYSAVLKLDVHAIRYEDVVGDFRPTVAAVLNYLGLEWTDAVLEFDKTAKAKGRIGTPSYHQVTQKIYTRAAGRWQKYRQHLEPVLPVLAPHALSHGYSMDSAEHQE